MTKRENFLAALKCEPVDQMPFVFTVDGFNVPVGVPEEYLNPFDMVKIDRWLGSYAHDRLGPSPITKTARGVSVDVSNLENGDQVELRSPSVQLRESEIILAPVMWLKSRQ